MTVMIKMYREIAKRLNIVLFRVVILLMAIVLVGCSSNPKEELAVTCIKDYKSRMIDPASLEIRGDVVYDKYTETRTATSEELVSNEYIFCAVGYKDAFGMTVADIILYCDGEYAGTMNESDKMLANSNYGTSEYRLSCMRAAIEYSSFVSDDLEGIKQEGTESEWKYTRSIEIVQGKKVAKNASVNYVKMD